MEFLNVIVALLQLSIKIWQTAFVNNPYIEYFNIKLYLAQHVGCSARRNYVNAQPTHLTQNERKQKANAFKLQINECNFRKPNW